MLAIDREVAAERGLSVRTVEASMDDLSALAPASFDLVIHPVSTCYVPDILEVYRQVARVLVAGGLYISQHKQPTSMQASIEPAAHGYEITEPYYRSGPLAAGGGQLASRGRHARVPAPLGGDHRRHVPRGICIEDLVEPVHADETAAKGTFAHRSRYVAPYVRIKARRLGEVAGEAPAAKVWLP